VTKHQERLVVITAGCSIGKAPPFPAELLTSYPVIPNKPRAFNEPEAIAPLNITSA